MNIIQLLKKDHAELEAVMDKLVKLKNHESDSAQKLFDQFKKLFYTHDKVEDKIIYPALIDNKELRPIVLKGYQAHHVVELGILELKLLPFSSENWGPKFAVVRDCIITHAGEEEELLFPEMSKLLDAKKLRELAEQAELQRGYAAA